MAYLIYTFIAALAVGSSLGQDMPRNYSGDSTVGCTTTKINATEKQEDFAWVLKGMKNLIPQIGWGGLAEGNLSLETSVYSQKTNGKWSMKVGSFPGGGKMYLCLNYVTNAIDEQLKISQIGAAIVSGNSSILLRSPPKAPHHARGPHPPHHPPQSDSPPPPPHHPPPPPHHPPPPPPPHHPPHGPHHHPPGEPPHMMNKMGQNGRDVPPPACQHIWFICPKKLEATFPSSGMKDSDDDFAIVIGIKAVSIHTEESSGSPQDCQVPRFQDIASTNKTENAYDGNADDGDNETEDGTVVNSGTTDMPSEASSPVP